jgi:hypothetical protein
MVLLSEVPFFFLLASTVLFFFESGLVVFYFSLFIKVSKSSVTVYSIPFSLVVELVVLLVLLLVVVFSFKVSFRSSVEIVVVTDLSFDEVVDASVESFLVVSCEFLTTNSILTSSKLIAAREGSPEVLSIL